MAGKSESVEQQMKEVGMPHDELEESHPIHNFVKELQNIQTKGSPPMSFDKLPKAAILKL